MTLAERPRPGPPALDAHAVFIGQLMSGMSVAVRAEATHRSGKWRLLAAKELAQPGLMTLQAVRHGERIVDFAWDFASAAAARLLGRNAFDLIGQSLLRVMGGHLGHLVVFDQYRRVVEHGTAEALRQVHVVNGSDDVYRHGAVRLGDGVAVTLTNLSAVKRVELLKREMSVQQERRTRQHK